MNSFLHHIHWKVVEERDCSERLIGCIFTFFDCDRYVSDVWLMKLGSKSFESHVNIDDVSYRGHGLGIHMYQVVADWLLDRGLTLFSTPIVNQTHLARCLWQSRRLNDLFFIQESWGRWKISLNPIRTSKLSALTVERKKPTYVTESSPALDAVMKLPL